MHWYFFLTTDGAMCSAHFSATSQTHLEELLNTYTLGWIILYSLYHFQSFGHIFAKMDLHS